MDQGQLGNWFLFHLINIFEDYTFLNVCLILSWLIASAASVLTVPEYYARVIPENQNFEKNNYAGILNRLIHN